MRPCRAPGDWFAQAIEDRGQAEDSRRAGRHDTWLRSCSVSCPTPSKPPTISSTVVACSGPSFRCPVDLLVYTEAEWQVRDRASRFVRTIEREAVWVHDAADAST
jgi:hypothetical protein